MDLRGLTHFLAVLKHGSITLAARELGLSQSGLSKSLKRLEDSLGEQLMERGRNGVSLTGFGKLLEARAASIREQMNQAELELRALRSASANRVAIGCGTTGAVRLLPQAAARLRAEHPEIRLQVLHGMSEALMPWVRDGTIDFALSSVPVTASDPAFEHVTFYFGGMAVVARAGHPLAARRGLKLAELADYPWCLPGRREMERRALDDLFLEEGLKPPEPEIETTSTALMVAMAMGSDYLSFLPQELVYWEQDGGRLVVLPVAGVGWQRGFGITRRRVRPQSAAEAAVIQALRAVARELYGPSPRGRRK